MKENCLLWEKAAKLARKRHLGIPLRCPVNDSCTGEKCAVLKREVKPTDETFEQHDLSVANENTV